MAVITFSRSFPAYHPKSGQSTHFVEQILNELGIDYESQTYLFALCKWNQKKIDEGKITYNDIVKFMKSLNPEITTKKLHTIRSGNRRNVGDKFYPVVWSGKPYNSPQIIFATETEIKKIFSFKAKEKMTVYEHVKTDELLFNLFRNDGFTEVKDMKDWLQLPKDFDGQIICWDDKLKY